ncbi:MAG: PorT family protein [Fibrobacter sp.]|nr:PorT family protein [Fibrobacter sp.]
MKKLLFAFLLSGLFLSTQSFAQKSYGIKGGFTISNFWGPGSQNLNDLFRSELPTLDERNLYWFTVGIFTTRELLPDFASVQTELLYMRGGKNWVESSSGDNSFQVFADYLQMPALLKITIPVILRPRIYVGPYISYMFRARAQKIPSTLEDNAFFDGKGAGSELFERYTNVIDLGMTTGFDFDVPFGPGSFVFDFRYNLGAVNVFNVAPASGLRNYNFLFMAGYKISVGGY